MNNPRPLGPVSKIALSFVRASFLSRGICRKLILNIIKKCTDHPIIDNFRGVPFVFNLDNTTEAKALFGHYNLQELSFLKEKVNHPDAVFVDLGANSGFYTQNFLGSGENRTALAIEPNPAMCQRIQANHALLKDVYAKNKLILENCAVGSESGQAELDLSEGLGAAMIVNQKGNRTITVAMDTLLNILHKHSITSVDVMKIDIEGYEDQALVPFFMHADPALYPRHIIIEHTSSSLWKEDLFALLTEKGYITAHKTRGNLLLSRLVA